LVVLLTAESRTSPAVRNGGIFTAMHGLSETLKALAEKPRESISLGELAAALRGRAHAFALLILVLPETIPLPVPSISIILGIPLVLIAAHLVLHGERAGLPRRVRDVHLPTSTIQAVNRWVGPILAWLEGFLRPRWRELAGHPRLIGVACLYLALVLALPLPLVNLVPALCLAALALGLIRQDGLFVAVGLAGTLLLTAALAYTLPLATNALGAIFTD
jgi:hypothetical protein